MNTSLDWPPLPIPINAQSRQQAEAETSKATITTTAEATEETYRRSLATLVIQYYLRLIDVPHRLEHLPSGLQLQVEELGGYVACCAVTPNADKCKIPEIDRTGDPKGYLFVELSAPYHTAQVLGFAAAVTVSELPLSYLQPLSAFVAALEKSAQIAPRINVSDWAKGLIAGWQSLHDLPPALQPAPQPPRSLSNAMRSVPPSEAQSTDALVEILATTTDDVVRWRAAEQLATQNPKLTQQLGIQLLTMNVKPLADVLDDLSVALLVGIILKPDETFLVGCRLYATGSLQALPEGLRLQGIEEDGIEEVDSDQSSNRTFCELVPATHGDPLEYLFTAEAGDCFSLNVHYAGKVSTHMFILPPVELPSVARSLPAP